MQRVTQYSPADSTTSTGALINPHPHHQFPYWNTQIPQSFAHPSYCSSYAENSYSSTVMSSSNSPQQSTHDSIASESESDGGMCPGGPIKLWQFLLELLQSSEVNCIEWTNNNPFEFRFTDRVEVARLWGKRKNKPKMNYEKLARSLRYYYGKDMIEKGQPGEKYVYHFTKNLMSKEFLSQTPSSH
uniref:ETS domain-containing protein n=1 Tax=Steinernema glaseri TaxID=37863 RepID=A0A1I7YAB8_9BILA